VRVVTESLVANGLAAGDVLVAAVSGGVDSMTLLTVLAGLRSKLNVEVVAVHVNHGLRKTAGRDERVVAEYAQKLTVPLVVEKVSLGKRKTSIEERARELRYLALRQVAANMGAKYILTAHTADDQIETILFNFLRGAGVRGLAGMKELADGVLRPFLKVHKAELSWYAKSNRVPHALDETNKSKAFTRNRIRLTLLPDLKKYNPQVEEQILRTGELMAGAERALTQWAGEQLRWLSTRENGRVVIARSRFRELDPFAQTEVLKAAVLALGNDLSGLTQAHFDEALKFVANLSGKPASKRIGGKLFVTRAYDKITVSQTSL